MSDRRTGGARKALMRFIDQHLPRRLLLPLFARLNPGDITIRHHHTGARVRLHSFRHKGYWWHGARREAETMEAFRRVLRPGDTVVEVGAHIGYIALFFSHLVGPRGRVVTFEPGDNNLPYVRANVAPLGNVRLVEKAVGDRAATMTLHLENLTGQNNSLVDHFAGLAANQRAAAVRVEEREVEVEVVTLDAFCAEEGLRPALVKIDVEGFEHEVLLGARGLLAEQRPIVMVEVQRHAEAIFELLRGIGYALYRADGSPVRSAADFEMNTFCLDPTRHADALRALGWSAPA